MIPLGLKSAYQQDFIIKADQLAIPEGADVMLHDKFLNKYVALQPDAEYRFSISKENTTQGDARFELTLKPAADVMDNLSLEVVPNPATDKVLISFKSPSDKSATIRVTDVNGVTVYSSTSTTLLKAPVAVPLNGFASGVYLVEVTQGNTKLTRKLVKE